jgi:CRISPR/Cas system-associated exonuclease Cas4 (RecB family)
MPIPEGFIFSQGKLQDYIDCQRRFQLRYLIERSWPALEAQPAVEFEQLKILGHRFHQLIHQYIIRIPEVHITETIDDDTLEIWWNNFMVHIKKSSVLNTIVQERTQNHPEINITAPIHSYQIVAKYDLITVTREMNLIIFDWKTSKNRPERSWLNKRMQTKIYPYLLVKAGNFLNSGNKINPDHVEMVYWYANYPDRTEIIKYSRELHLSNENYLNELIDEIDQKQDGDYVLTSDKRTCRYCVYRSLCERGNEAGLLEEISLDLEIDNEMIDIALDSEQIAEIEF